MHPVDSLIHQLNKRSQKASQSQLNDISQHLAVAPFAETLLEVDGALWGSFWQFDVLAPGYLLPAVELALLRAVRLDQTWPQTATVDQFLASLRQVLTDSQAGVWTLPVGGEPCIVFAAFEGEQPTEHNKQLTTSMWTIVWYCATTGRLHAGYRSTCIDFTRLTGAIEQHQPGFEPASEAIPCGWLHDTIEEKDEKNRADLTNRLDVEILKLRLRMTDAGCEA